MKRTVEDYDAKLEQESADRESAEARRLAYIILAVFLTVAAIMVVVAGAQEKPAEPAKPIPISAEDARMVNVLRQNWDAANGRVQASRQQYERDVELRAEARIGLVGEVERLRIKANAPANYVLDFESMTWKPNQR